MTEQRGFHCRLNDDVKSKLEKRSSDTNIPQNTILNSALEAYFNESSEGERQRVLTEVYALTRRVKGLRGDIEILAELFSFFIFHWFGYTPRLERSERAALAVEAKERHDKFIRLFLKKVSSGDLSISTILGETMSAQKSASGDEKESEPNLE